MKIVTERKMTVYANQFHLVEFHSNHIFSLCKTRPSFNRSDEMNVLAQSTLNSREFRSRYGHDTPRENLMCSISSRPQRSCNFRSSLNSSLLSTTCHYTSRTHLRDVIQPVCPSRPDGPDEESSPRSTSASASASPSHIRQLQSRLDLSLVRERRVFNETHHLTPPLCRAQLDSALHPIQPARAAQRARPLLCAPLHRHLSHPP